MASDSVLKVAVLVLTLSAAGCDGEARRMTDATQNASTIALDAGHEDASVTDGCVPDAQAETSDAAQPGGACDVLETCCASLPEQSRNWCQHNLGFLRASGNAACARVSEAYCMPH